MNGKEAEEAVTKKKDTRRQIMKLLRQDFENYKVLAEMQIENLKTALAIMADRVELLEKDAMIHPVKKLLCAMAR